MILEADWVVPITSGTIEGGAVSIGEGRILEVGEAGEVEGDEVLEFPGCALIPGLINTHCHSGMTLLRGYADDLPLDAWLEDYIWPSEGRMGPEHVRAGADLACAEMLLGGTTSFADMYFHMESVAEAVEGSGMRALLGYGMIDAGKEDNVAEEELEEGLAFAGAFDGAAEGRIKTAMAPHSPETCSADMFLEGRKLLTHLSETEEGVLEVVKRGDDLPVEFLDELGVLGGTLAAHAVHVYEREMELLAERGTHVSHCPSSNLKLGSGIAPVPEMMEAGVNLSLGTDSAASNNSLDMFREMRLAALIHKGVKGDPTLVSASEALEMATVGGARALELEAGALEAGALADVVAVDLDAPHNRPVDDPVSALVFSAGAGDVTDVFVGGKRVVEDGELKTVEVEALTQKAEALASEVRTRQAS